MSLAVAKVVIGLGSNLGNRAEYLEKAKSLLGTEPGVNLLRSSRIYESDPADGSGQPPYLNQVVLLETRLAPVSLLNVCRKIEADCGRERTAGNRWESRTLDLDILFWEDKVIAEPDLTVPHPEAEKRSFVLVPLADLLPEFIHPVSGKPVRDLITGLKDQLRIHLYEMTV